ncbi:hypothetical protein J2751_002736 [Halorubrum alkaliphilum]|uniref:DUF3006 domain-containing protein n=1 Tax=Halorubrum alkaliphilum TaxID=261290 RepID=A0A8T4GJX7_9EURY|nr:DUF3006 domain-containing protein [Halorubrum alkaliphilum]MBP1923691.1 hypothetical protein [Halorubrum alkaliphilum]
MNGTYTATVDRIVDGKTAVILIEDGKDVIEQFDVPADQLPEEATGEGSVLTVEITDNAIVDMQYDAELTDRRPQAAQERINRLSKRLSDRDKS